MSDSPELNPGLKANEIASPDSLHTEPPFVRPVYGDEPVETAGVIEEEAPKASKKKK
jgi:hypothetical protein